MSRKLGAIRALPRAASRSVARSEKYADYLSRLGGKISTPSSAREDLRHTLSAKLAPNFNLLESLPTLAAAGGRRGLPMEWNPLSQRLYTPLEMDSRTPRFAQDLGEVNGAISRFVEGCHEASHILLWEPLFCGRGGVPTAAQFIRMSLCFEAYCFWYGDIFVTRALRERLPDGEFALTRTAVSNRDFHPYRAFAALGIEDEEKILDVYLDTFQGRETVLFKKRKVFLVQSLFRRFMEFYLGSRAPVRRMYRVLQEMEYFTQFREKFCALPGLPSLLPEKVLRLDYAESPEEYCRAVFRAGLPFIEDLDQASLAAVRTRRAIQTRAYFAYSLRYALEQNIVFSRSGKKSLPRPELIASVSRYLATLETMILALAKGAKLGSIERICAKNDQVYSQEVRARFASADVWMAKRFMLLPMLETRSSLFGILSESTPGERKKLTAKLLDEFCLKILGDRTENALSRSRKNQLLAQMASLSSASSSRNWHAHFNQLILEPEILRRWSAPLVSFDPENNEFRELLFSYE